MYYECTQCRRWCFIVQWTMFTELTFSAVHLYNLAQGSSANLVRVPNPLPLPQVRRGTPHFPQGALFVGAKYNSDSAPLKYPSWAWSAFDVFLLVSLASVYLSAPCWFHSNQPNSYHGCKGYMYRHCTIQWHDQTAPSAEVNLPPGCCVLKCTHVFICSLAYPVFHGDHLKNMGLCTKSTCCPPAGCSVVLHILMCTCRFSMTCLVFHGDQLSLIIWKIWAVY